MTYKDLIDKQIFSEIREKRSWPADDAGSLADQLRIVWGAVLVLGKQIPLHLLQATVKSADLVEKEFWDYGIFTLPADLFFLRDDAGLLHFTVDEERRVVPKDLISFTGFRESVGSPFQAGNILVYMDRNSKEVHLLGGYEISMTYVPLFTEPTSSNYSTLDVPLPAGHIDQLVQLVGLHVEAVRNGNAGKSQVHGVLAELYGDTMATT